ncbi:MAG: hypothetical protein EOM91_09735 [Sphingobacteriia bacterium]|nr:hypothetical protein [Sphingobacteriia bacterium]NCC38081.1 hypothetical protein [Gammaproteobacteria bacterium]
MKPLHLYQLSRPMLMKAAELDAGAIVSAFEDETCIFIETERDETRYVWKGGEWLPTDAVGG